MFACDETAYRGVCMRIGRLSAVFDELSRRVVCQLDSGWVGWVGGFDRGDIGGSRDRVG